ncbi:MAG: hypothetical protein ACJ8AW_04660, partial [Rhodopila sp.]
MQISPQTIEALTLVISGGSGNDSTPPIGIYRSGPKLESYMRSCGVMMHVGSGSRLPTLTNAIIETMNIGNVKSLKAIIERAADPRDFIEQPEKLARVLAHLNSYLVHDGYELQQQGSNARLVKAGTSAPVITSLTDTLQTIDFDTVNATLSAPLQAPKQTRKMPSQQPARCSKASAGRCCASLICRYRHSSTYKAYTKRCATPW